MFKKLTDFSYVRNSNEAFGFYLSYLLFIALLSLVVIAIFQGVRIVAPDQGFRTIMRLGTAVAVTSCMVLSFIISGQKKLAGNFAYLLLCLCAGVIASFGGSLLGLIIPAYLTTKEVRGKKKK